MKRVQYPTSRFFLPIIFRYVFGNKRTMTINLALHAQTYTKQFKQFHLQRKKVKTGSVGDEAQC